MLSKCALFCLCVINGINFSCPLIFSIDKVQKLSSLKATCALDDSSIIADIENASKESPQKMYLEKVFSAIAHNKIFRDVYWQKNPFICTTPIENIRYAYTMESVQAAVEGNFLEAGRGTFEEGRGGWNMVAVSEPRGMSYNDAKLQFSDVKVAMSQRSGTVVFNSAGTLIPELARVCLDAVNAFEVPSAINMYLTNAGQKTSAPPHTDKQDVFVLQTQGQKRWRVFRPPPPARMPRVDPLARGKATDTLELTELEAPLLDVVLEPGHILYVPAGFPHTTDTITGIAEGSEASVHLTLGLDTHIWSLHFAGMREAALRHAGLDDKLLVTKLDPNIYWDLQSSLPLGFQGIDVIAAEGDEASPTRMRAALASALTTGLVKRLKLCEPRRWPETNDEDLAREIGADSVAERMLLHHWEVTEIFRKMYEDVAYKITPAKLDLSFFRSQPYLKGLENVMDSLLVWSKSGRGPQLESKNGHLKAKVGKKGFGGSKQSITNS